MMSGKVDDYETEGLRNERVSSFYSRIRQPNTDSRSFARSGFDCHLSAMRGSEIFDQCKAQSCAILSGRPSSFGAYERLT